MFKIKGPLMQQANFAPNFPLEHAEKDMRLAVAHGASLGLGLPVAAAADEAMKRAMAEGLGKQVATPRGAHAHERPPTRRVMDALDPRAPRPQDFCSVVATQKKQAAP